MYIVSSEQELDAADGILIVFLWLLQDSVCIQFRTTRAHDQRAGGRGGGMSVGGGISMGGGASVGVWHFPWEVTLFMGGWYFSWGG